MAKEYEQMTTAEQLDSLADSINFFRLAHQGDLKTVANEIKRISKLLGPQEKIPIGINVIVSIPEDKRSKFENEQTLNGFVKSYDQCDERSVLVKDDNGNMNCVDLTWCQVIE